MKISKTPITTTIKTIIIRYIHIGDVIHHQDQAMKFVNFKTIKATVKRPINPIPLLELFELDILLLTLFV